MIGTGVLVVGSYAVGLTLRAERWPVAGETVLASDFDQGPGGKGSNQAIQVARLGGEVELVGLVGLDAFGDAAVELLESEGVGTSCLTRTPDRNTGIGFIVLDGAGENRIVLDPGANADLSPGPVRDAIARHSTARVVVAQLEIPLETATAALEEASARGAVTVLNPAPAQHVDSETLRAVDIVTPNQPEARVLVGRAADDPVDDLTVCAELLDAGVGTVVLTRGPLGVLVVTEQGATTVRAFEVDVVDSTGAGDAFNGALAASLARGDALEAAVERACAAGALACTKLGVVPALAYSDRVDALLSSGRRLEA
jgi:ribokinase